MATGTQTWYFTYGGSDGDRYGLDVDYHQFNGSTVTFPSTATNITNITINFSDCLSGNFPGTSSFAGTYNVYFTVLSGSSYVNLGSGTVTVYGYNYRSTSSTTLSYIDSVSTLLANGISGLRMTDDGVYIRGYTPSGTMSMVITYEYTENPTITAQPSITSMSPTSGQSTTIQWSAATVTNQGSSSIYYQYFVGPSSTYSDSYHIGTTSALTATITEANILAKCGSTFEGTCYVFVRAYWDNGSTQGGWTTPTGKAFTYAPHRTVKYYNDGSWVECIPYYYTESGWVECIPYYYTESRWVECSH